MTINVVDLFAGPGGLAEGFASLDEGRKFKIAVSVEMETSAHQTLTLRSFYRHVRGEAAGERVYYAFCNDAAAAHPRDVLPNVWKEAEAEAKQLTLGVRRDNAALNAILDSKLLNPDRTVVIGGPPCQAYSLVGRSKNMGTIGYVAEEDKRHFLYREYLRILHKVQPAVFVMENVKGILSSRVGDRRVMHDILRDLTHPGKALRRSVNKQGGNYRIYSLVAPICFQADMDPGTIDVNDFVVQAERYGVPQARHRVILLGVRGDLNLPAFAPLIPRTPITVHDAISELPPLRSRLSSGDDAAKWQKTVAALIGGFAADAKRTGHDDLSANLKSGALALSSALPTGGLRVKREDNPVVPDEYRSWVADDKLAVWLNHEARSHMASDLGRYFYAAVFAEMNGRSPKGQADFILNGLAPNHANWSTGKFEDRFRVQRYGAPSTTVTSHIAKDGHYFIHPDPAQCRSLTVREAARLQSFPDNYFFQGNRTQQYHQVGNAVPCILARSIAHSVIAVLQDSNFSK